NFAPSLFMQVIHSDTSYADLVQGARLLRESVSQGTEALKILVHNNFDRFVDARNKIDLLYDEMKLRSLNEEAEYGTRAFSQALQGTTHKADEIYNPIIDRRARVEKVRSTLSVVERYKFYFNLPSSLIEYTRKGRFDIAVREYKKGRLLLQAVTVGQVGAVEEAVIDDTQATALSKIFQYVWKEVQESVVELRNALFRHLGQPWRPYSEQENVIRYLLEVDPGDKDPVAYYLERQHAWIVEQMQDIYRGHQQKAAHAGGQTNHAERRRTFGGVGSGAGGGASRDSLPDAERRADELVRALGIESFSDFPAFAHGRDSEYHLWKQIYNALRLLSQTLVRCLPDFWKLSQAYMEEMYQKPTAKGLGRRRRPGLNLERVTKCHSLLEEIIEKYSQYVLRLTGILGEGEGIVSLDCMGRAQIQTTLLRLPQTHALLAGHFMTAIMELVVNTANDIEAIDMAQEPAIILANLISQLKAGLVLFLCEMWDRDAQYMSLHENWCLHHGTGYWPPFYIARRDRQNAEGSPATVADVVANTELLPLFLRTAQTISGQLGTIHSAALQPGKSTRTMMQGQTPHFDAT
ncbi:Exocyst complex component S5, partial [Coemansia sp. RSA 25]